VNRWVRGGEPAGDAAPSFAAKAILITAPRCRARAGRCLKHPNDLPLGYRDDGHFVAILNTQVGGLPVTRECHRNPYARSISRAARLADSNAASCPQDICAA
jgi:hypothetical protein